MFQMFQLSFGVKFISRSTTVPESSILENKGALSPPPSIRSPSTPGIVLAMLTMVWQGLRSSWVKILENAWFDFFELGMTQKKIATPILLPVTTCSTLVSRTTPWVSAMSCEPRKSHVRWHCLVLIARASNSGPEIWYSSPQHANDTSWLIDLLWTCTYGRKPTIKGYAIFKQFASVLFPPTQLFRKERRCKHVAKPNPITAEDCTDLCQHTSLPQQDLQKRISVVC